MPKFDGTGPMGQGPRTGRGMGNCQGAGMGYGRAYGNGQGACRRFLNRKEESEMLKDEESILEQDLKAIKERLAELKDKN